MSVAQPDRGSHTSQRVGTHCRLPETLQITHRDSKENTAWEHIEWLIYICTVQAYVAVCRSSNTLLHTQGRSNDRRERGYLVYGVKK